MIEIRAIQSNPPLLLLALSFESFFLSLKFSKIDFAKKLQLILSENFDTYNNPHQDRMVRDVRLLSNLALITKISPPAFEIVTSV